MPQFAAAGPSLYHMPELLLLFIVTVHCIQAYALLQSTQQMRRPAEPLLSLFNILRNRDLLVINMGTDSFLCLCHMAAADGS